MGRGGFSRLISLHEMKLEGWVANEFVRVVERLMELHVAKLSSDAVLTYCLVILHGCPPSGIVELLIIPNAWCGELAEA